MKEEKIWSTLLYSDQQRNRGQRREVREEEVVKIGGGRDRRGK